MKDVNVINTSILFNLNKKNKNIKFCIWKQTKEKKKRYYKWNL